MWKIIFGELIGEFHAGNKLWVDQLVDWSVMVRLEMRSSQYSFYGGTA